MIKSITIIGSGVMGCGIAQSFALSGYFVIINDLKEEYLSKAQKTISRNLALLIEEGTLTQEEMQDALNHITYRVDLDVAVRDADFIIEAIPEVIELKWGLYHQLEQLIKPNSIIASNTSTFPISLLMKESSFADRMVITHFFNPAHLVPLVEIVQHDETNPKVVEVTLDLMRKIGKSPVLLKKEIAGFIANRLQTALMREAFYLLKEGVANAEDIDKAITAGPGFRWAFTGPIEIADFGGLDTWQRVFDNVAPELDQRKDAPVLIRSLVDQGKLGTKSGEGIFRYEESTVSQKIDERDRNFIKLGRIKMEKGYV